VLHIFDWVCFSLFRAEYDMKQTIAEGVSHLSRRSATLLILRSPTTG
jgi:hypothetical protein